MDVQKPSYVMHDHKTESRALPHHSFKDSTEVEVPFS